MQQAKTLLQDQQATVAAVAAQVGCHSDVAVAAAFKRHVAHRRVSTDAP